jgi:hypothetical protein
MAIKTYADTSAVSLAYAFSDAYDREDILTEDAPLTMKVVGYTSEGFSMSKESQRSESITDSRRPQGSKNTKGVAEGQLTQEFGVTDVFRDMLQAAMMNTWSADQGGYIELFDGDNKQYMVWERTIRLDSGADKNQKQEQYYGTLVNEATLQIGDGDLMTLDISTMSANASYIETKQEAGKLGGSVAAQKTIPSSYEIADGSNNIDKIVIRDSNGVEIPMTFSSATLTVNNNARIQDAIGHVFAAGVATGMVEVSVSGEVYYSDASVFDAHMNNTLMSVEFSIETVDGRFEFTIPAVTAESPDANAGGQNQDLMQSVTLNAQQGKVGGVDCVMRVRYYSDDKVASIGDVVFTQGSAANERNVTVSTNNLPNGTVVTLKVYDRAGASVTDTAVVASDEAVFTDVDLDALDGGTAVAYVSAPGVKQKEVFYLFDK